MNPCRIAYFMGGRFANGGTEAVVFNYLRHLDPDQFKIDFIIPSLDRSEDSVISDLRSKGHYVFFVPPRGKNPFAYKKELDELFKKETFDAVHTHCDASAGPVLEAAAKRGVKVRVAHSHSTGVQMPHTGLITKTLHQAVLDKSIAELERYSTLRVACSRAAGEWLFGDLRFEVVLNGIDIDKFTFDPEKRAAVRGELGLGDSVTVMTVGRLSPEKEQRLLIRAFARTRLCAEGAKLVIVGGGPLREELRNIAAQEGIYANMVFTDSRTDVDALLSGADIFCLTSRFEGLGLSAVEAQCAGLPCIVSEGVPLEACVTHLASPVQGFDPDVWARAMDAVYLTERRPYRTELKRAGYDAADCARRMAELYRRAFTEARLG